MVNLKLKIKAAIFSILMATTSVTTAGTGIDFLYGVGIGAFSSDEQSKVAELDASAAGEFIFGFEEDGFAFEITAMRGAEAGTAVSTRDYTATASSTALSYRTIEDNNQYYKFKFGKMSVDLDFSDTTATAETEGNIFGVGWGMRMNNNERLEVEYMFYSSSDIDNTHLVVLRYLFGGTPPDKEGFK